MKKFILKLEFYDDKEKRKALKIVSTLSVIGTVDPVSKLRKFWPTDILSVGPEKEPEQKEEAKKEEQKKEENKEEAKEEDQKKEEEAKKEEVVKKIEHEAVMGMVTPYRPYNPSMITYYYAHQSLEENPHACVIC